jgi:hypothetical protein
MLTRQIGTQQLAPSGSDRNDVLAQLAELSRLRANDSISDEEFRMLRIEVLKASLISPIIAAAHDRWQVAPQPRRCVARAIGVSIYTLLLNHVPGAITLSFVIDIVLRFGAPETLCRILDSDIFKCN